MMWKDKEEEAEVGKINKDSKSKEKLVGSSV